MSSSGIVGGAVNEAMVLAKAAQRVAALALVDASIALPRASPVWNAALNTLQLRPSSGSDFMLYRPSSRASALLIFCHPSEGSSLCRKLAEVWEEELQKAGVKCTRVDLCNEEYLGIGSSAELKAALSKAEGCMTPEAERLQRLVEEHRYLIFVHPIFWFEVPAQLKGFLETVLSSGFAFRKLPSCWTLNRAVGLLERLPVVPALLRRYSAFGLLRDKNVYITRTQGGPAAGMGIFGHHATSLESSMQFCGARIAAVNTVAEVDDKTPESLAEIDLPVMQQEIARHCANMAAEGSSSKINNMMRSTQILDDTLEAHRQSADLACTPILEVGSR